MPPSNDENSKPITAKDIFLKTYREPAPDVEATNIDYNWICKGTPKLAYMLCNCYVSNVGARRWYVRVAMLEVASRGPRWTVHKQSAFLPSDYNLTVFSTKKRAYKHINKIRRYYQVNYGENSQVIGIPATA